MDYLKADLPSLITTANNTADEAQSTFGRLTAAQLNWKPSPERWSVAQCFDHLLTTNKGYFPEIDNVLAGKKREVLGTRPGTAWPDGKAFDQGCRSRFDSQSKSTKSFSTSAERYKRIGD